MGRWIRATAAVAAAGIVATAAGVGSASAAGPAPGTPEYFQRDNQNMADAYGRQTAPDGQLNPNYIAALPAGTNAYLQQLGNQAAPAATLLDRLTSSLSKSGAIGQLMSLLFNGTTASNGFDRLGHYVRDELLVSDCTGYATSPVPGCSARFAKRSASAASDLTATPASVAGLPNGSQSLLKAALAGAAVARRSESPLSGLLGYLIGPKR
jgi:hypothetical protein